MKVPEAEHQWITTRFPEIPCSVLLSNVQLKITWGGRDIWVKGSSRTIHEVSGTSFAGRVAGRQSTLSSYQRQPNDDHQPARSTHKAM